CALAWPHPAEPDRALEPRPAATPPVPPARLQTPTWVAAAAPVSRARSGSGSASPRAADLARSLAQLPPAGHHARRRRAWTPARRCSRAWPQPPARLSLRRRQRTGKEIRRRELLRGRRKESAGHGKEARCRRR
ncbi:unnamed protein product, partial [Urochloa humidicola]